MSLAQSFVVLVFLAGIAAAQTPAEKPSPPAATTTAPATAKPLPVAAPPAPTAATAAIPDVALKSKLDPLLSGFEGVAGYYVKNLGNGATAAAAEDEIFPTASLVKIPILLTLFDRIEKGELDYHATLVYETKRLYPGEDLLGAFKDGEKIALSKLCLLMTAFSDNTASLWLQELAGGGTAINAWLAAHGFTKTRVNSRTEGREEAKRIYGWGQTTPREMAELVVGIREGRFGSRAAGEEMFRLLSKSYWDGEALSALPPWVAAASKQGAVNASRSEVVLVTGRSGAFVMCVITKEQKDQSWGRDNAGFVLLRRAMRACYEHFEPADPWRPDPDASKF